MLEVTTQPILCRSEQILLEWKFLLIEAFIK
jgi:hypothetical protein